MSLGDTCEVKFCSCTAYMHYGKKRRRVCKTHWGLHTDGEINLKKRSTFKPRPGEDTVNQEL
jgi:hypothetical protein